MRKTVTCLAVVSLLALGGPAIAELCTIDAVPAATLLFPHFQVDLDSDAGVTTLFSVNNASAAPIIAHVTMWTDWSIPTLDFDLYLTGFDVQSFNIRDIFNGDIPQTAPDDAFSNLGQFSAGHLVLNDPVFPLPPSCVNRLPVGDLLQVQIDLIRTAHTGQPVVFPGEPGNQCWGETYPNDPSTIARGYITVDVVQQCSVEFPNTAGYFAGTAGFDNVLWGDYFYVDPTNNFAQGETAVHIESGTVDTAGVCTSFGIGDYTFYGRYVPTESGFSAADCREPLATTFATRFLNGGPFGGGTDLVCWRDSKSDPDPVLCGLRPDEIGFDQQQVVVFDEEENPDIVVVGQPPSPIPPGQPNVICPIETQIVSVGSSVFPAEPDFGWTYLNLNHSLNDPTGLATPGIAQAWVTTIMSAEGLYSVGFDAIQLDSACSQSCFLLSDGGVIQPCTP